MKNIKHTLAKQLIAALAAAALFTPIVASAQDYADAGDQQIQGTISSINGAWNITVNDANGYRDSVELHQGTVINPTGLTLEPGMNVTIDGYGDGSNFEAMEIDTPYQYQGPAPTAVYYGPGTWYPGYASGWGPSFSLFLNLNTRQYEQRSFAFGGQVRRPMAPPLRLADIRPHGFVGYAGNGRAQQRTAYNAPRPQFQQQQRWETQRQQQPQRNFAPQQQPQRVQPQQPQRTFAPQQQTQQRTFSDQRQQQRSFAAPQQQQQQQARPAAQPQQARPVQPQRDFSSPTGRMGAVSAPPREANQQRDDRRR